MSHSTVELHFKKTGTGRPLIILHGLFGLGDNWSTLAKQYALKGFSVYLVDLRNHGRSPHSEEFNYDVMAADVIALMDKEEISMADLIGHSMGGKVAMRLALDHPKRIKKLVVVDIAPRYYAPHHQAIISALDCVHPEELSARKEAEEILSRSISETSTVQFLLKNLYWAEDGKLAWRFNLPVIKYTIEEVGAEIKGGAASELPVLFVKGEHSGYISDADEETISSLFPLAQVITIPSAGHWVHAENPESFYERVLTFLDS